MSKSLSYILAIDQGTSSTKSIIFDEKGQAICKASAPLKSYFFEGDHVEQDPEEIYENVLKSVKKCLAIFHTLGGDTNQIKACGISNQRETFVIWDKTGQPLHNAIVWQCKRSIDVCNRLEEAGFGEKINQKTGLVIDPYFSGTKVIWLYENNETIRNAIDQGEAYFGNIDTWLLYKMTKGKSYLTDYTNASRTLFFNLHHLEWDRELLLDFGLFKLNLPEVKPSAHFFGKTRLEGLLDHELSIASMIGDSHAAAFGESCFEAGDAKATLGTGSSILMNIGSYPQASKNGMVSTICWSTDERVDYAMEGIIVSAGATIEWLKNQLSLFENTAELESLSTSVPDNGGVYIVPAFSGLGAPHWDMNRRGSIEGLSFESNKAHIIRAALESIPYQIKDVISAMEMDTSTPLKELKIDGGISANKFVVQFLADLLERKITTINIPDVSALGAAYLAGLKQGIFLNLEQLKSFRQNNKTTSAGKDAAKVKKSYLGWQKVIGRKEVAL